mmetsp:Transcript_26679/g.34768  ORF Transcript_26679/g.34768 Transcript_26679/m.34768 type:complete len:90 (+) Transcript_26679:243-512(+)
MHSYRSSWQSNISGTGKCLHDHTRQHGWKKREIILQIIFIVTVPAQQYFSKPLGRGGVGVLLMNCKDDEATIAAIFRDILGLLRKQDDC